MYPVLVSRLKGQLEYHWEEILHIRRTHFQSIELDVSASAMSPMILIVTNDNILFFRIISPDNSRLMIETFHLAF
jgi:hypothetical protein